MAFNFGNTGGGDKKPFSFGTPTATPTASTPANIFGNNQSSTTPAGNPPTSGFGFGAPAALSSNIFGQQQQNSAPNSTQTATFNFGGAATQAPAVASQQPAFGFGNTSTTPAQAPASTGGLFGLAGNTNAPASSGFGGFGGFGKSSEAKPSQETAKPAGSSFSFGTNSAAVEQKPAAVGFGATPNATTNATPAAFSFNTAKPAEQATGQSQAFNFGGAKSAAPDVSTTADVKTSAQGKGQNAAPAAGTFGFGNKTSETKDAPVANVFSFGAAQPVLKDTPAASGGFSFGKPEEKKDAPAASGGFSFGKPEEKKDAPAASGGFSFGKPEEKKDAPAASGGFSFGKPEEKKDTPATAGSFSFGKPEEKKDAPATAGSSTGKTEEKKEAPAAPSFSFGGKPAEKSTNTSSPLNPANTSNPPATPAPVSLKNKTMEDLISKWSADLDKYSQEFQKQARQISTWDQALLTSGDQISRLYAATVEAEQSSGKVDQALNYIENQQDELSQLLDSYESQVRDISNEAGLHQPADQEREKAYQQAEALIADLESMGKNISDITAELNTSTSTLTRMKDDDPLSSIVKILNSQVQTLTWIDENTTKLSEKVDLLQNHQNNVTATPQTPTNFKFGSLRV